MRFANPFVFILQFGLIQLYRSSNGDTGWLSINGTALILNKRVLHVSGLLNGISPRKTTSAHLVRPHPAAPRQQWRHWMAEHKRNGANLEQEGPTRARPAEWNQSTQDDIGASRCAEPTGSAPSRPPIKASLPEATVIGHGFTSGMRFANPFVFILQFGLIQLHRASNGDTGWLSINGTALILNKRVLHVPGLLNGISPRKTTSAHLGLLNGISPRKTTSAHLGAPNQLAAPPSRPPIKASLPEATVIGHGFTSGMRFANPFVFILQFGLIQLHRASNGDTGWLSINGTALILNKRVLHVPGLLNGISPRKTTSAHLGHGVDRVLSFLR
ncbi:hypothetical protein MRX96_033048 [Rhipicephalus microplus]